MPNNSEANIATADALTLLLHNQHAICAAIEEVTKWLAENGVVSVAANATTAMEKLDTNAQAITDTIIRLRQS
jgi:archaellum biogenesis ATPase FlaH